jgi:hypothetical protein
MHEFPYNMCMYDMYMIYVYTLMYFYELQLLYIYTLVKGKYRRRPETEM